MLTNATAILAPVMQFVLTLLAGLTAHVSKDSMILVDLAETEVSGKFIAQYLPINLKNVLLNLSLSQIHSLYSPYYAEAYNEFEEHISAT